MADKKRITEKPVNPVNGEKKKKKSGCVNVYIIKAGYHGNNWTI